MNRQNLYKEFIKLAPFEDATDDYRKSLSKALKQVKTVALALDVNERPKNWDSVIPLVGNVIEKLKNIALNSYKGFPSTAYKQLSNLLGGQIQDKLLWKTIPVDSNFYRMRTFVDRRNGIGTRKCFIFQ